VLRSGNDPFATCAASNFLVWARYQRRLEKQTMKLEKWALIAEIVSAIAIVLSLIFVGLQVRQGTEETAANSRALEATVRESMLNADLSIMRSALPYSYLMQNRPPATDEETRQFGIFFIMLIRSRENYWTQHANGMLDDETYRSYRETFLNILLRSDLAYSFWRTFSSNAVQGFVAEINEELESRGRMPKAAVPSSN
jgi:hypothetical protein